MTSHGNSTQEITYREAIVAALQEEMRRDPKTLVMGEDVGPSGGPFKTCQGLIEEFGHARVRDTPIAETGFVGAALGLAITGYRPIVEIMFADFLGVCFDQIVNGLDITIPIGLGYNPKGASRVVPLFNAPASDKGGDFSIGLNANYLDKWRFGVNYTHYFGSADGFVNLAGTQRTFKQLYADRDFISFTAHTSF